MKEGMLGAMNSEARKRHQEAQGISTEPHLLTEPTPVRNGRELKPNEVRHVANLAIRHGAMEGTAFVNGVPRGKIQTEARRNLRRGK